MKRLLIRIGIGIVVFNMVMGAAALVLRRLMPSSGDEHSDEIALAAAGRGIELRSEARAFRGGTARAIMGGLQLDLRGASLDPGGALLEVQAIMGGVQIFIPEDWQVRVIESRPFMGGIDHPEAPAEIAPGTPVLELRLRAVMGGIDVRRRPAEAAAATEQLGAR